jgi:hypothetical protein
MDNSLDVASMKWIGSAAPRAWNSDTGRDRHHPCSDCSDSDRCGGSTCCFTCFDRITNASQADSADSPTHTLRLACFPGDDPSSDLGWVFLRYVAPSRQGTARRTPLVEVRPNSPRSHSAKQIRLGRRTPHGRRADKPRRLFLLEGGFDDVVSVSRRSGGRSKVTWYQVQA